jgi:hypothetical protein
MTRPEVFPFRFLGDRWNPVTLDLRVVVTEDGPVFFADDVCAALSVEVPTVRFLEPISGMFHIRRSYTVLPSFLEDLVDADGEPIPVYSSDQVHDVADRRPYSFTVAFLGWFDHLVTQFQVDVVDVAPDEPNLAAKALHEFAAGQTFSVARAAVLLRRDPLIDLGRDALFQRMRELGWLSRDHETWIPATAQLQAGHLIRHRQRVRGRKDVYPQVRITRTGLETLHKALGGVADLDLDNASALTLVELP